MQHDFLYPLRDKNRDEYILVELDGFIFSAVEILFQSLRLRESLHPKFPKLEEADQLSADDFYEAYSLYYPEEGFLQELSNGTMSDEAALELSDTLYETDVMDIIHRTTFQYAITNLLEKQFVKQVVFINQRPLQDHEYQYIYTIFSRFKDKLILVSGNPLTYIKDHPELTTIALNDATMVNEMLDNPDEYHLSMTAIILRLSLDNMTIDQSTNMVKYFYEEQFNEKTKGKDYKVLQFPIDCIRLSDLMIDDALPEG